MAKAFEKTNKQQTVAELIRSDFKFGDRVRLKNELHTPIGTFTAGHVLVVYDKLPEGKISLIDDRGNCAESISLLSQRSMVRIGKQEDVKEYLARVRNGIKPNQPHFMSSID